MADGCVEDGTVATAPSKQGEIWQLRERIAEALLRDGYCYKVTLILDYIIIVSSNTTATVRHLPATLRLLRLHHRHEGEAGGGSRHQGRGVSRVNFL